jgi:predicted RNA methylase
MINSINAAFESASIDNNSISFPQQMTPKMFTKVKNMITNLRGKYVSKGGIGCFELSFNPTVIVNKFLTTNEWPKKNPFALFPTPMSVINYALEYTFAGANEWTGYELVRIFEPSAGNGCFIDAVVDDFAKYGVPVDVVCAEIDPVNIEILKCKGYKVIEGDFLNLEVSSLEKFDLIITNPPFLSQTYLHHVNHAQRFLKTYGKMMAVLPTSLFTSMTKRAKALKQSVAAINIGEFQDCIFEGGTFEYTDIETMLVTFNSVEQSKAVMDNLTDYASRLMCLCLNNERGINTKINKCKSSNDVSNLMPYLVEKYRALSPYSFVNDDVIKSTEEAIKITLGVNYVSTVPDECDLNDAQVQINVIPLFIDDHQKANTCSFVLTETECLPTLISTMIAANLTNSKKTKPRKVLKVTNENQLDLFSFG